MTTLARAIEKELERLHVDCSADDCSGLSVRRSENHGNILNVYDDYADMDIDPDHALAILKTLAPEGTSLNSDSAVNIWQLIMPAKH
jgi:hypothetical protein